MTIETKLSLRDEGWFISNNIANRMRVELIDASTILGVNDTADAPPRVTIKYGFRLKKPDGSFNCWLNIFEDDVYATKQELLNSL